MVQHSASRSFLVAPAEFRRRSDDTGFRSELRELLFVRSERPRDTVVRRIRQGFWRWMGITKRMATSDADRESVARCRVRRSLCVHRARWCPLVEFSGGFSQARL